MAASVPMREAVTATALAARSVSPSGPGRSSSTSGPQAASRRASSVVRGGISEAALSEGHHPRDPHRPVDQPRPRSVAGEQLLDERRHHAGGQTDAYCRRFHNAPPKSWRRSPPQRRSCGPRRVARVTFRGGDCPTAVTCRTGHLPVTRRNSGWDWRGKTDFWVVKSGVSMAACSQGVFGGGCQEVW